MKAFSGFLGVGGYLKMEIARLLTVLRLGAIEPGAAIPTGLAPQAYPTVAGIGAALSATLGVLVMPLAGERMRSWLLPWHSGRVKAPHDRNYHVCTGCRVMGLGLFAERAGAKLPSSCYCMGSIKIIDAACHGKGLSDEARTKIPAITRG